MKLKGVTWWTRIKPVKATTTQLSIDSGLPENKEDEQENKIDELSRRNISISVKKLKLYCRPTVLLR
jgi:hypothetical protein